MSEPTALLPPRPDAAAISPAGQPGGAEGRRPGRAAGRDRGPDRPSGSGKSSLLHAAGLLERPTGGEVHRTARTSSKPRTSGERTQHPAAHHRLRLSVPPPAARVRRARRQRGPAAAHRRQAAARRAASAPGRCWAAWAWPSASTTSPPSFRAASSSAWPSPGPWPTSRGCSWPTSRPATSIRPRPARCSRALFDLARHPGRRRPDRHPQPMELAGYIGPGLRRPQGRPPGGAPRREPRLLTAVC